jgi:phosphate transport system substrate-binding protein
MKKLFATLLAMIAVTVSAQEITGAGATFPAPLYSKWASEYNKATNIRINYQSVGSGAGIKQIEARTVTFGASDMPLTDEKLKESGLFQFPTVIGGVVPVINLKGIEPGQLRLTGTVIADIFLGKITKWNDNAIKVLNPTLALPEQAITVVRRADGSGTTFIWTNYLSKVSKEFKDTIGDGTAVNWKVGAGGKGNEGVAAMVRQLPGTLGYVEFAYVKQTKMNWVNVQNSSGTWVAPTEDAFKAAAANADWNKTYYQILTNQEGKEAWPISGATFILVHTKPTDAAAAKTAINFFDWAFTNGDKAADDLDYVALPLAVKNKIRADWKKLALH